MDSLNRAFDAQPALEDAPQDTSKETCSPSEDGIPTGGSPSAEEVVVEAPLKVAAALSFSAKLTSVNPHKTRMPNWLLLSSYVPPQEWVQLSVDTMAPGLEGAREIINHWSPFKKRESSVTHMRDLYPTLLRVPVATRVEEYSISFPGYMDKETFQRVAKDGMLIRNHEFHQ